MKIGQRLWTVVILVYHTKCGAEAAKQKVFDVPVTRVTNIPKKFKIHGTVANLPGQLWHIEEMDNMKRAQSKLQINSKVKVHQCQIVEFPMGNRNKSETFWQGTSHCPSCQMWRNYCCVLGSSTGAEFNDISWLSRYSRDKCPAQCQKTLSQKQVVVLPTCFNDTKHTAKWLRANRWTSLKWPSMILDLNTRAFLEGTEIWHLEGTNNFVLVCIWGRAHQLTRTPLVPMALDLQTSKVPTNPEARSLSGDTVLWYSWERHSGSSSKGPSSVVSSQTYTKVPFGGTSIDRKSISATLTYVHIRCQFETNKSHELWTIN